MNAPMSFVLPSVRIADLTDPDDVQRTIAYVHAHPNGTPFHLPAWNLAVASGCRQRSHYLIVEADTHIGGVLPLTEVHSPLFGRALVSAGFAVGGGVLAADDGVAALLVDAAIALATRLSCPTIELKGGDIQAGWHHDSTTYLGFTRPLAADDDAELLAIPRKQRAEVRKSLDLGMVVETGTAQRDRDAHYAVYATSVRNLGTPVFPRALFDAVLDAFGNDADILTVYRDGVAVASVLSLYYQGTVMPYWGGGTAAARSLRANELMYYALMNHARRRGCLRFDFGRSKAGTGAAAYKKNWGFEPQPLSYAKYTLDGSAPRSINPLDPKYHLQVKLWQKMPLIFANRLGPMIARGLG
jgi:FemAB-related protein (PEP-CTERM system-associated)